MVNRRKLSSTFKAKVAIEALTLAELSHRFAISQEMVSHRKGK